MTAWRRAEPWNPWRRFARGVWVRVATTFGLLTGGLAWILFYALAWASHFAWYVNLAVILSSLLVVPAVVVILWVSWGLRLSRRAGEWADQWLDL